MQERWVWGLLVVAVVGLGPGDSQVDMARAGVCSGLVLTTEAWAGVQVLRPRGFEGQEWGLLGKRRKEDS